MKDVGKRVKARVQTVLTAIKKGECSASLSSGTTSVSSSSSTSSPTVTESKFTVKIICDTLIFESPLHLVVTLLVRLKKERSLR